MVFGGKSLLAEYSPFHMQQLCVGNKLTCLAVLLQPVLLPNRGKGAANALMLVLHPPYMWARSFTAKIVCWLKKHPLSFFLGEWIKFVSCKLTPSHMCRVNPSPPPATVSALGGE